MTFDDGSVSISIRLDTIQEKTIAPDRFVIIVSFGYIRTILLGPQDYPVEAIEGDLQTGAHVLEGFAIEDVVDMHYLTLQLVSRNSYERLSENIHGATRPRINITQLRNLGVCVCPLLEQREIVRRVEAMFKLADAVEKRVEAAKLRAEKLTQAILAKAFRGELVPTEAELARREGRSYESASELLARIKSERESRDKSRKLQEN